MGETKYPKLSELFTFKLLRDAKLTQIFEGANQIQRIVIAREMLKERS